MINPITPDTIPEINKIIATQNPMNNNTKLIYAIIAPHIVDITPNKISINFFILI